MCMISSIRKAQSKLRLRSIGLLLQLFTVILISMTFMLIVRDNFLRIEVLFQNSTIVIFNAESSSQLGYSLELYQLSISQAINSNNHTLISIEELYTLIKNTKEYIHTQTYPEYGDDSYNIYNGQQFGYWSASPLAPGENQQIMNFTRLLNEYLFEFSFCNDVYSLISYFDYGNEGLQLQYPRPLNDDEGQPVLMEKQLDDFKSSNLSSFLMVPSFTVAGGPIYLILFSQLKIPNIINGALRYDQIFYLNQFPELYSIITDQNWNIHTYFGVLNYTSQEPLIPDPNLPENNITFQLLTGFSQEDWGAIITQEQSFVYNAFIDKKVFAKKQKFMNSDMRVVMYQDVSSYLIQQDQIMAQLQTFATEVVQRYYIMIIVCIVVSSFFQTLIIIKILKPFTKLTLMVENQIYSITKNDMRNSFQQQLEFSKHQVGQPLKQLYLAIIKQKKRSSEQKSEQLNKFQELSYPRRREEELQIRLDNITDIYFIY